MLFDVKLFPTLSFTPFLCIFKSSLCVIWCSYPKRYSFLSDFPCGLYIFFMRCLNLLFPKCLWYSWHHTIVTSLCRKKTRLIRCSQEARWSALSVLFFVHAQSLANDNHLLLYSTKTHKNIFLTKMQEIGLLHNYYQYHQNKLLKGQKWGFRMTTLYGQ